MKAFTPLFQAVIAFVAVLTGLGIVFNLLLAPVKKDIEHIKAGQVEIKKLVYELKDQSHNQPKQPPKPKQAHKGK